ncbi:hypothetical protein [Bartonella rattimassiliensis]|uniref:HTH cro/C1-type domain-containing protein n=1 Tax=Bartonella rattimassiliensis 15908 TaxID=1094556 RepID=J0QDZ4_9HYPH|nr:hypothetical protein [Bartonella rattimassiliensis]EJF83601.1 hypothetical protein MCY_01185 [Bartonella rattimassiliensis 15908]
MDFQKLIKMWINEKLNEMGHGSRKALGQHLGLGPSSITRLLSIDDSDSKAYRDITAEELVKLHSFFKEYPPYPALSKIDQDFYDLYSSCNEEERRATLAFLHTLIESKKR